MSNLKNEEYYLAQIFSSLKQIEDTDSVLPDEDKAIKENDINISSSLIFQDLYYNLVFYYKSNRKEKITTNEQKYVYKALFDMLNIIYESNPKLFRNIQIKLCLIYLIDFFKESKIVNLEIVCKLFFSLKDSFKKIINNKISDEINKFEEKVFETTQICVNKFVGDFQVEIENIDKIKTFGKLIDNIQNLKEEIIPLHLKGFIKYYNKRNNIKSLIIKIYGYIEEINPFKNEKSLNIKYHLYQGYSLYEILLNYKNEEEMIYVSDFYNLKTKRIKNFNAKSILELSIKLLSSKTAEELEKVLNNENINAKVESPKISDKFNNTQEYYEDLYNQLIYYIMEYKTKPTEKICKIIYDDFYRVLWLNFNKLILLNLSEKELEENHIKVIFYFIVNVFSPDIDTKSALEFREDTIPILYSQCNFYNFMINKDYLFKILDKDYSQYYTLSEKKNEFDQILINIINKQILENKKVIDFRKDNSNKNCEIIHILDCCKYLPFPLLQHYLIKEHGLLDNINPEIFLYNFYRNCFCDLESFNSETFIETIRAINILDSKESEKIAVIEGILKDESFLKLLKEIMISNVMRNVYFLMNEFYFSNGKLSQDEEKKILENKQIINLEEIEKETIEKAKKINNEYKGKIPLNNASNNINANNYINEDNKIQNPEFNFINDKPIISYYNKFCQELKKFVYKSNFIIMGLPKTIKGFTFRFLKIVINTKGIILNMDEISKITLLKAYLIFVLIHVQNHFIKRYFNISSDVHLCDTPNINGYNKGGKHLIKLLFGEEMIHKNINLEQAKYILDINNWTTKSILEFKNGFQRIQVGGTKDTIIYLTSEYSSECDHSKLHI